MNAALLARPWLASPLLASGVFLVLLGPFAGDYVATLAAAWPRAPRPVLGRSGCSRCGAPIPATRQIPVVSWLMQRGRRTCCGGRVPIGYLIGEVAGLVAGLAAATAGAPMLQVWAFALGLTLTYIALVDLRRFSIPAWGLAALMLEVVAVAALEPTMSGRLARLATGGVLVLAFTVLRRFTGRGARAGLGARPGLGIGDVMLAGLLGALMGWRLAAPMVSVAALAPLALQVMNRKSGPVPFGFWLSVSTALFLLLAEFNLLAE